MSSVTMWATQCYDDMGNERTGKGEDAKNENEIEYNTIDLKHL